MFGWFKKRESQMLARMGDLTRVAQMATFCALSNDLGYVDGASDTESSAISTKAAARANCLFGQQPSDMHAATLDMDAERGSALDWLRREDLFRELVVQSLRVIGTVQYGTGAGAGVVGESILIEFGPQYPESPNPTTYPSLVRRAVATLSARQQAGIAEWASRGG